MKKTKTTSITKKKKVLNTKKTLKGGKTIGEGGYGKVYLLQNNNDVEELCKNFNINLLSVSDVYCRIGEEIEWKPITQCYDRLRFMALKYFFVREDKTQENANKSFENEVNILKKVFELFKRYSPEKLDDLIVFSENGNIVEQVWIMVKDYGQIKFVPFRLCDGTLKDLVISDADKKPINPMKFESKHIINIIETIASFLETLTKNEPQYHHNDIKLDNIMYIKHGNDYKFYVGDYGMINEKIKGGTYGYISPISPKLFKTYSEKKEYIFNYLFKNIPTKPNYFTKLMNIPTKRELIDQYDKIDLYIQGNEQFQKNDIFCIGMMLLMMLYHNVIHDDSIEMVKALIGDMLFLKPYTQDTTPKTTKPVETQPSKPNFLTKIFGKKQSNVDVVAQTYITVLCENPINNIADLVSRIRTLKGISSNTVMSIQQNAGTSKLNKKTNIKNTKTAQKQNTSSKNTTIAKTKNKRKQ